MKKKLYVIVLDDIIIGDLIHGGLAIYKSKSEAKEKLNFISTYAIEYFSNQGIEPYPKSRYSIKEYILKEDTKRKKLDIMGKLFTKLSNSKIPSKYIIKLYTKKELYQQNQKYIQKIEQLQYRLAESEKEIERLNHRLDFEDPYLLRNYKNIVKKLKQSKTQLAIQELEKLRNNILINQKGDDGWTSLEVDLQYLVDTINEQIEKLEGEK